MNEIPIFQDVDPGVLNVLCRDSTDDLSQVISVTNVASAIALFNQVGNTILSLWIVAQVSQHCKTVLDKVKDRMYYINKRIGEAQKSVAEYQKKVNEKQQYLESANPEELFNESKSKSEIRFGKLQSLRSRTWLPSTSLPYRKSLITLTVIRSRLPSLIRFPLL